MQLLSQRSAQKSERLYSTMVVGLRQPSTANMANHYFAKQSQHLEWWPNPQTPRSCTRIHCRTKCYHILMSDATLWYNLKLNLKVSPSEAMTTLTQDKYRCIMLCVINGCFARCSDTVNAKGPFEWRWLPSAGFSGTKGSKNDQCNDDCFSWVVARCAWLKASLACSHSSRLPKAPSKRVKSCTSCKSCEMDVISNTVIIRFERCCISCRSLCNSEKSSQIYKLSRSLKISKDSNLS